MKYDVLGVGNALLDFQIEVSNEFLEKHGLKKGSMSLVDAATQHRIIAEVEATYGHSAIRKTSGGCTANTLAGLANYGGRAYFVGKIGCDANGETYVRDLKKARVDSHLEPEDHDHTGTCLALITPDAERTMLTHLGIATQLKISDIKAEKIQASDIVYIEGYLWDPPSGRSASKEAIQIARQIKKKVAFTFSDSFCVKRHLEDFLHLAKNSIDILFCNEHEALEATGETKIESAFRAMKNWAPIVAITTGPKGALLSDSTRGLTEEIGTWDVKLVDKLGAGDLFAAGFLFGLIRSKSLKEAGYLGCYSATKVIQQMSARLDEDLSSQIELAIRGPSAEGARRAAGSHR
jgi:sugar/nucleoside kinase (ribokinase family)